MTLELSSPIIIVISDFKDAQNLDLSSAGVGMGVSFWVGERGQTAVEHGSSDRRWRLLQKRLARLERRSRRSIAVTMTRPPIAVFPDEIDGLQLEIDGQCACLTGRRAKVSRKPVRDDAV